VTDDAVAWLLAEKEREPRLVEIMQHGFDHVKRDKGEFGGNRSYDDQYKDLFRGKQIMKEKFGKDFLPCLNFPFGPYNKHSMRAVDDLGYRIVSSHYNYRLSRRLMYAVGHFLRRGQIKDRHISYHLGYYPRTKLYSIDMAVSFIESYLGEYGSRDCVFHSADFVVQKTKAFIPYTPVIGILLHHRFHTSVTSLDLITEVLRRLQEVPGVEFLNMGEIYDRYCPDPGIGFRNNE